jgi:hypothetical protein
MARTAEAIVKDDVKLVLHEFGFIKAGDGPAKWPVPVHGWYYMPVKAVMGVNGIFDFVCMFYGAFIGIETKAPGKLDELNANQQRRHAEVRAAGGIVIVADNANIVKEYLHGYRQEVLARQARLHGGVPEETGERRQTSRSQQSAPASAGFGYGPQR